MNEAWDFTLRPAALSDREALRALIEHSARELSRDYYQPEQIEAALRGAFGVDTNLIEDGTYFVAEASKLLIGGGGWSRRRTMFGGDSFTVRDPGLLDPASEPRASALSLCIRRGRGAEWDARFCSVARAKRRGRGFALSN